MVYFPAISAKRGERVVFNFGRSALSFKEAKLYAQIEEPVAEVNNYSKVAYLIIEYLKTYLVKFYEFQTIPLE